MQLFLAQNWVLEMIVAGPLSIGFVMILLR